MNNKKTVLFHRDFAGFTGGHLKVWDYFQHVNSSKTFSSKIFFTANSSWNNNPWNKVRDNCLEEWNPDHSDILFLAGMDWLALTEEQRYSPPSPVINLIQSVRHADKNMPLYEFLKYPATRICVGQEVADAINSTGVVNGLVVTNTNGIDLDLLPEPVEKDIPFLIVGIKNRELASKIASQLSKKNIQSRVLVERLTRDEYLSLVARVKVILLLPYKAEGFYLPALEAMYLRALVICPDCVGNRGFCIDDETCFKPDYDEEAIIRSIMQALLLSYDKRETLLNNAYERAKNSTLSKERGQFLKMLSKI